MQVNDIVLAIFELLSGMGPVLYIDIDCHHGDGVEQAFYQSDRVLTLSLHRFGPGYFPGTGDLSSRGARKGFGYTCNVPLKEGIRDGPYLELFSPLAEAAVRSFKPAAVVLQCGADSLSRDPLVNCFLFTTSPAFCLAAVAASTRALQALARCLAHRNALISISTDCPLYAQPDRSH